MRKAKSLLAKFRNNEDGAALIEYTVMLVVLLAATLVAIGVVATGITRQWTGLNVTLGN
jgi:pilus assembly protein Flp/PilA